MCLKPILRVIFCLSCLTISTLSGLAQSGTITIRTVAGNGTIGWVGTGGPATSSALYYPTGVAVDAAGNLYIADYFVHKVTPGGLFNRDLLSPEGGAGGVAVDAAGNLFMDDNGWSIVFKVTAGRVSCCVAGTGTGAGFSGDGGPATSALLKFPNGLAVDAAGNLYIADTGNHRVRKVTPGGMISTVAGNGSSGFSGDGGPATAAQLNFPTDVAVGAAGNLYITSNNRVRMVTPDGVIRTVAGNGTFGFSGDGGPATSAQLDRPAGIAVDAAGILYIADSNNNRVRMVTPEGVIRTVAGNGIAGFSGDGGPAAAAQLDHPSGIALDAAGNLFIADTSNYRVRKVGWSPPKTDEPAGLRRDFNGDGRGDILWRDKAGNVSLWLMNGYSITDNSFIANIPAEWTIVGSGDFNGDGKADMLWRDTAGNVSIWLMDGSTISSYSNKENMPKAWAVAGVADFDADGKADILWRDTAGNVSIWLMSGHSIANYSFIASIPPDWNIAGTGDFNGDGKADILWRNTAGNVSTWLMDGTTISSYNSTYSMPTSWAVAGIADFDGDGRTDILWRDAAGDVAMWPMSGHTVISNSLIANISMGWAIAGTGDFNGDKRADILWRDNMGDVSIWLMDGTTISGYQVMGNVSDRMAQ